MEYIILKLGGSLISPKGAVIDENLVSSYAKKVRTHFGGDGESRLIMVVGGGNTSRQYRDAADACGEDSEEDRHRIGITATWLNGEFLRAVLSDVAYEEILGLGVYAKNAPLGEELIASTFEKWLKTDRRVLIAGGFITGVSTDFNAVILAQKIGTEKIFKLTDVDFVYSEDPKKNPSAEPIKDISWEAYFKLFGVDPDDAKHGAGAHLPIDFKAAKLAMDKEIGCVVADGSDAEVVDAIVGGKGISGTLIHG